MKRRGLVSALFDVIDLAPLKTHFSSLNSVSLSCSSSVSFFGSCVSSLFLHVLPKLL